MSIDISAAREALARWQDILRLRDWDIRIEVMKEDWRKSGDMKVDAANKLVVLLLNESIGDELEEVVLHELVHLKLNGMDRMVEDLLVAIYGAEEGDPKRDIAWGLYMDRLEETTQDLTKALFAAAGLKTEAVSRSLRDSVDQEISEGHEHGAV